MYSIDDVISDKCFYSFFGGAQQAGDQNWALLFNPNDSGVAVAVRQFYFWTSNRSEWNMKWTRATGGIYSGERNSLAIRSGQPLAKSKAVAYRGTAEPLPSPAYAVGAFDQDCVDVFLNMPIVLMPGTGVLYWHDTTAETNWTSTLFFEEKVLN